MTPQPNKTTLSNPRARLALERRGQEPRGGYHARGRAGCLQAFIPYARLASGVPFMLQVLKYVVVHDSGTIINPLILAGQIHGGVAQGIAMPSMSSSYLTNKAN
jgi:hypothetical protein